MSLTDASFPDRFIRKITATLAAGLLAGSLLFLALGGPEESSVYRGDFPAFYAAAEIVWSGRGEELYDRDLQRDLENLYWPELAGDFFIFAYPPYFALIIAPLAAMPPLSAKVVASTLLLGSFFLALLIARAESDFIRKHFWFCCLYLLTFAPFGGSIVGVQNTALSILVFAAFYRAIRGGHHFAAGLIASLLLYKPQFGVLLLLFLVGRWRRAELLGWSLGALALYLAGMVVLGIEWPLVWLQEASRFGELNFTINGDNMISLVGVIFWLSSSWLSDGDTALAWGYVISVVLLLASVWSIRGNASSLILAPYLILFLSPQTLFYDIGIAAFVLLYGLRPNARTDFLLLAALWLYGGVAMMLRDTISFPLLTVPLIAMAWVHYRRVSGDWMPVRLGANQ